MHSEVHKNKSANKDEIYHLLLEQIDSLISTNEWVITHLANITALIKQTFSKVSWVGFYIKNNNELYLGPFQGKVACTRIKIGSGVCGKAAELKTTQVVPNVHEFPGHIACDDESNSEIVVPIFCDDQVIAVLDLDSTLFSTFGEIDKHWLEEICNLISKKINFNLLKV